MRGIGYGEWKYEKKYHLVLASIPILYTNGTMEDVFWETNYFPTTTPHTRNRVIFFLQLDVS